MINRRLTSIILFALTSLLDSAYASEKITIIYNEQSPYIIHGSWGPYGLIGDVARNVSVKTPLEFTWEKTSVLRQEHTLKENPANTCVLGATKTERRKDLGVYTHPIYQEKDFYLFARADDPFFNADTTLKTVLSSQDKKLIRVKKYPYHENLLELIEKYLPPTINIGAQAAFAFQALEEGRGDYVFLSENEGAYLAHQAKRPIEQFRKIKPKDLPPGEKHYFLCTKSTSPSALDALNHAIQEVTHDGAMH